MTLLISPDVATSIVATAAQAVDLGTSETSAWFVVYAGPVPVSTSDTVAPTSEVLLTVHLANPAFGAPAVIGNSVEALAFAVPQLESEGEGSATFFRLYDREGDVCFQGLVSDDPASGAALILNQTNLTVGAVVNVERLVIGVQID